MAHFRGTIQGNRGEASRCGHDDLVTEGNGWNVGIRTYLFINGEGEDEVGIVLTGGSNKTGGVYDLGSYTRDDLDQLLSKDPE